MFDEMESNQIGNKIISAAQERRDGDEVEDLAGSTVTEDLESDLQVTEKLCELNELDSSTSMAPKAQSIVSFLISKVSLMLVVFRLNP